MNTREQLQEVTDRLAQLDPNNRDHLVEIATLRTQITELTNQVAQEEAAQLRIQEATEQAAYFLDNLVIEGLSMRDLCGGEKQYQMLRIVVQEKIISLDTEKAELKQQIDQISQKLDEESQQAYEDSQTIIQLRAQLSQSQLDVTDYQSKLKNATDEIDRLNSQVNDLRTEIAVGARNAYKVIDSEEKSKQLKVLADEIKASRIKITNRDFTDYTHKMYYATLMQDLPEEGKAFGDRIEFPAMYAGKYVEVTAEEAEQFRAERAAASNQEADADIPLGNTATTDVAQEETFPSIPQATLPTVPTPVVGGTPEVIGQGQTVEERLTALEKRVVELEKVCNVSEDAA